MSDFAPYLQKLLTGYMTEDEFHELANYNGDCDRIDFPDDYRSRMAELQARWQAAHDTRYTHYLLHKPDGSEHASTQCGQRERPDMGTTQDWDAVDCHRCWYYRSLEIMTGTHE